MKKIWLIIVSFIAISMIIIIYQQHQLIKDYRSLLHSEMEKLNVPIERILEFHQEAENYNEKERAEKLERLNETFADFSNYTGSGLQLESWIGDRYFITYNDTKLAYFYFIKNYMAAPTTEERDVIYKNLKERYDQYREFLKVAEEELTEPFE
ncbi:hypothetical protein [Solibacillus sp. FSL K6-4121]|uniref:hypothetical protein n=1 Tax=Solibacillus sp. FSL K6-4121 TaxID=2921505 RepID=UPI0030F80E9F